MSTASSDGTDAITASEIGEYLSCERAWWYARQGEPSLAAPALAHGTAGHAQIGRELRAGERAAWRGRLLLLAGALLLVVAIALVVLHL